MSALKRFKPLVLLVSILVIVSLACGSSSSPTLVATSDQSSSNNNQEKTSSETEPTSASVIKDIYQVGDIISINNTTLVVLGWVNVEPNEFMPPDEGMKFIGVELLLINESNSSKSISTLMQMSLKDEKDQKYNVDLFAASSLSGGNLDGELVPGERVRGKVGFEVPEDVQNLQFVFDAAFFSSGKVFVDLGSEPISMEPPSDLASSTVMQVYNVGDLIEIKNHTMAVLGWEDISAGDFLGPDPGNKFVAVEMFFANNSQSRISISTLLQMNLKDEADRSYEIDFSASSEIKDGSVDGSLVPGEKIRGKVGFQVPENVQNLQFVFDASVFGSGKVVVDLGASPVSIEPPTDLATPSTIETFIKGDSVEFKDTMLTVNEIMFSKGSQFNTPDEGYNFLMVDITIKNTGTATQNVSTLLQMYVKDSNFKKYTVNIMASMESSSSMPEGELAPGESIRGQVGFQVPVDSKELIFVLEADVISAGKIFISLD
ncbi:MAG: DUF4352 domain-containing protein [Anaerolineaceae bacterium]|nr:DUF4352 domain-containing protein [Anaerolineaceae bacterium]